MSEYLWDGSGTPDPFVTKLEQALAQKRARITAVTRARRRRRTLGVVASVLATAAAAAVAFGYLGEDAATGAPTPVVPMPDGRPAVALETSVPAHGRTVAPELGAAGATEPSDREAPGAEAPGAEAPGAEATAQPAVVAPAAVAAQAVVDR